MAAYAEVLEAGIAHERGKVAHAPGIVDPGGLIAATQRGNGSSSLTATVVVA